MYPLQRLLATFVGGRLGRNMAEATDRRQTQTEQRAVVWKKLKFAWVLQLRHGMAWPGLAWHGAAWLGVACQFGSRGSWVFWRRPGILAAFQSQNGRRVWVCVLVSICMGGRRLHFDANVGLAATSVVDIFHAGFEILEGFREGRLQGPWLGRVSLVRFGHFFFFVFSLVGGLATAGVAAGWELGGFIHARRRLSTTTMGASLARPANVGNTFLCVLYPPSLKQNCCNFTGNRSACEKFATKWDKHHQFSWVNP